MVFYPFHPLYGQELETVHERGDGAVMVIHPDGYHLKIPVWMTSPEAANLSLTGKAVIRPRALLTLTRLIEALKKSTEADAAGAHGTLSPSDQAKGGNHGETTGFPVPYGAEGEAADCTGSKKQREPDSTHVKRHHRDHQKRKG